MKLGGSDYGELSYTPFSKPSGEPIPLPITLPPGSALQFRVTIPIGISQKAAPDLYKYQGEHLDLTEAAQLYSWNMGQNGTPKDIFGNDAFDGNGYRLSVPKDELKKLIFPVVRLKLQSTRGKTYSAISSWYKEIYIWSKEDWDKANREVVAHRNDPLPWEKKK